MQVDQAMAGATEFRVRTTTRACICVCVRWSIVRKHRAEQNPFKRVGMCFCVWVEVGSGSSTGSAFSVGILFGLRAEASGFYSNGLANTHLSFCIGFRFGWRSGWEPETNMGYLTISRVVVLHSVSQVSSLFLFRRSCFPIFVVVGLRCFRRLAAGRGIFLSIGGR